MDWNAAIMYKNYWLKRYNNRLTMYRGYTFVRFLDLWKTYKLVRSETTEINLILQAITLFETLSPEEQVHVTLMGW